MKEYMETRKEKRENILFICFFPSVSTVRRESVPMMVLPTAGTF